MNWIIVWLVKKWWDKCVNVSGNRLLVGQHAGVDVEYVSYAGSEYDPCEMIWNPRICVIHDGG